MLLYLTSEFVARLTVIQPRTLSVQAIDTTSRKASSIRVHKKTRNIEFRFEFRLDPPRCSKPVGGLYYSDP